MAKKIKICSIFPKRNFRQPTHYIKKEKNSFSHTLIIFFAKIKIGNG